MQPHKVEVIMKLSIRYADKIVGTLIVLALATLIIVIVMLGTSHRWFSNDNQYRTVFTSAAGLSPNMPIQYKGFTIGLIRKYGLTEDNTVEANFIIFEQYIDRVRMGSVVEIIVSPIGLGNLLIFHPGRGTDRVQEGGFIPEINSIEGKILLSGGLVDRQDSAADTINHFVGQADNILNQVNEILDTVLISLVGLGGADHITQIIKDVETTTQSIAMQLPPIMENMETVTSQISAPSSSVMSLLDSNSPIFRDITASIHSISEIIENLNKTSEFIPTQLPQIALMLTDVSVALRSAQDVLVAVSNNPLLRGGIPQRVETSPGGAGYRHLEF